MHNDLFLELLEFIIDGGSRAEWLSDKMLPNNQLLKYVAETVGADKQLESAIAKRSDYLFEKVLFDSDKAESMDKNDVPGAKLAIDTLKWFLSVENPEKFSTKVVANSGSGEIFLLDTGIRRGGNEGEQSD